MTHTRFTVDIVEIKGNRSVDYLVTVIDKYENIDKPVVDRIALAVRKLSVPGTLERAVKEAIGLYYSKGIVKDYNGED